MQVMVEMLEGQKLASAECVYDYLQMRFETGVVLNIFTKALVIGANSDDASELIGLRISSIKVESDSVVFSFGDKALSVSIADEDYHGPEAMECVGIDGQRIVWN